MNRRSGMVRAILTLLQLSVLAVIFTLMPHGGVAAAGPAAGAGPDPPGALFQSQEPATRGL